jgi:hypothetical protein
MSTLATPRDARRILERVGAIRPDRPRRWGRMSAPQMVCHLGDAFRMALGEMPVRPGCGPLRAAMMKCVALYAPLPWPRGIMTRPEVDQEIGGTKPGDFAADLARLEALIERFAVTPAAFAWPPHPMLGRMSRSEWLRWGYLHTDHHLRQFGL